MNYKDWAIDALWFVISPNRIQFTMKSSSAFISFGQFVLQSACECVESIYHLITSIPWIASISLKCRGHLIHFIWTYKENICLFFSLFLFRGLKEEIGLLMYFRMQKYFKKKANKKYCNASYLNKSVKSRGWKNCRS